VEEKQDFVMKSSGYGRTLKLLIYYGLQTKKEALWRNERMCDCYWEKCKLCDTHLPVHISDFCMERDKINLYCGSHLPTKDIVIYELIEDESADAEWGFEDHFSGWKMGVRYLVEPPDGYGLRAVEPNVAASYLAEYIDKNRRKSYFTSYMENPLSSKELAIQNTLLWSQKRIEENKKGKLEEKLVLYFEEDKELWEKVVAQEKARKKIKKIFNCLEPIKTLKKQDRLIGGVLIGSLVNREYVPGLSDIDFFIIGKNLKRALKTEYFKSKEFETDINIICRSPGFFEKSLRRGNPVDLIALKYGEIIYDNGYLKDLKKKDFKATEDTFQGWLRTGLHHFEELIYQYFSPCCSHCFFRALYHSGREFLRALLLKKGEDVLEGWELKSSARKYYPKLFSEYTKICQARKEWNKYPFPLFSRSLRLSGQLGKLVCSVEKIAREILKTQGLNVPPINNLLKEIKDMKAVHSILFSIPKKEVMVLFGDKQDKIQTHKFTRKT
jgi:predicted nucleotidyltransferase